MIKQNGTDARRQNKTENSTESDIIRKVMEYVFLINRSLSLLKFKIQLEGIRCKLSLYWQRALERFPNYQHQMSFMDRLGRKTANWYSTNSPQRCCVASRSTVEQQKDSHESSCSHISTNKQKKKKCTWPWCVFLSPSTSAFYCIHREMTTLVITNYIMLV